MVKNDEKLHRENCLLLGVKINSKRGAFVERPIIIHGLFVRLFVFGNLCSYRFFDSLR